MGRNRYSVTTKRDKLSKLGEHNHRTYQYKFIWHRTPP
ncbi:hypothetical protein NC652_041670 [Populus alba x Populus x berolinensis]|nr:hypothetical protein NC652_041670 [Populus alba x Populus x berolinensis]